MHQPAEGQQKADLKNDSTLRVAAEGTLDTAQFEADLQDQDGLRTALHTDLQDSAALGVFGTPTFHLPDGNIAYFRFANLVTEPGAALDLWNLYTKVLRDGARIETVKRAK